MMLVRGLDTNDEEDWDAAELKVLQEDVEEQEHQTRDSPPMPIFWNEIETMK